MEELVNQLIGAACVGGFGAFGILFAVMILKQFLIIGRPNEVLVFSGRSRQLADGTEIGYREVFGGWSFRVPVFEKVSVMDLTTIPIDIGVRGAYSKGGIPLSVHAVANVKVSSDRAVVRNAIERFLDRDPAEIKQVAKETLEGTLRGVLAQLTPEEVNEDRLKFAAALIDEAEEEFARLGLHLDTLKIQNVHDEVNYLDSIGRRRIAEIIRDAEIAESTAKSSAERVEADAHQKGEVASQNARATIAVAENELRQVKAELEAEAKAEEERALAAAEQARAVAELELQEIRQKLVALKRQAEVVLPADAERQARELLAAGAAATIEENGRAMAQVLQMMTDTWLKAGSDAKDIFLIQQLEAVLTTVVTRVKDIDMGEVVLLDSGDGQALPRHVASFPAMVNQILDELRNSTGVDVRATLAAGAKSAQEVR